MSGQEGFATQPQLKDLYEVSARELLRLRPAYLENGELYEGPIPTEPTDVPLIWSGELSAEEIRAINPVAAEVLQADHGLQVIRRGPESLRISSPVVLFVAPYAAPGSGLEEAAWMIEHEPALPGTYAGSRHSSPVKEFRVATTNLDLVESLKLETMIGDEIPFNEARALHSIALALPRIAVMRGTPKSKPPA